MSLFLGYEVDKDGNPTEKQLEMPAKVLVRHMAAFGSTGSGKTVLAKIIIEEAAMEGIWISVHHRTGCRVYALHKSRAA